MKDAFKPSALTIRELFSNADSLYKIPRYQRPYKWGNDQVEKLWDDIYEAFKGEKENYFLGSIITAAPGEAEKTSYRDVVDGQQRLTTLMILFCVVRDLYPDLNQNSMADQAVTINTIKSSINRDGVIGRLKLFTHERHQSKFDEIILNDKSTSLLNKPSKKDLKNDVEPEHKFINTAVIFSEKLKQLGQVEATKLIDFLFNQVMIIRIDCSSPDFAIKLFQVLNDRGMDLTPADLLKSFLMEKLFEKYKDDQEIRGKREGQFMEDWNDMERSIASSDLSLNDLFIIYEYYLLAKNPEKSLREELEACFKDRDPNEVVRDIKEFASSYIQEIVERKDKTIFSFSYVPWSMYWKSICLAAIRENYNDFDRLAKALRRFYYLYWIAGKTLSQIKQSSFNLIARIKSNVPIDEIEGELNKKLEEDGIVKRAIEELCSKNVASEAWIKPLLLLMNYNLTDESVVSFVELNKDVHLEHIMPVKAHQYPEWGHISKEEHERWLNSAGNLTLLGGAKNIEASNNPFGEKMKVYEGRGLYDTKNSKITAFKITQTILSDYRLKKYDELWSIDAMKDRWEWFCDQAGEILEIDAGALKQNPPS